MSDLPVPFVGADAGDPQPLPLIVAARWKFPLQYHLIEGVYWFAVQDWIRGLTSGANPTTIWADIQRRGEQTLDSIQPLPYVATDGKTYRRDYTDDKGLYDIAAHLRATKARPALGEIKDFLAKAGVFVDRLRRDPDAAADVSTAVLQRHEADWKRLGRGDDWVEARVKGIFSRKAFVSALKAAIIDMFGAERDVFWRSTETLYKGLWQRTTAQLREDLGITTKAELRDHFGKYALIYTGLAEQIIADKLGEVETVTFATALEIIWQIAHMIYSQARQTAEVLGIDLVTNKPLLKSGKPQK